MAISLVTSNSAVGQSNDSTPLTTPDVSGSTNDDDLIIITMQRGDSDAIVCDDGTFTQLENTAWENTGTNRLAVYYKIASSESGGYGFTAATDTTGRDGCAGVAVYRGVNTSTPFDVTYVKATHFNDATGWDKTPTPNAITTSSDNAWALIVATNNADGNVTGVPSTGYTEDHETNPANNGYGQYWRFDHKLITPEGTDTPVDITYTATEVYGNGIFTLALRPESVATDPLVLYTSPGLSVTNP